MVQAPRLGPIRCCSSPGSPTVRRWTASGGPSPGPTAKSPGPGMVNAILRSLERSLDQLPTIPQEDPASYYGTLYSHPAWLVQELLDELGSEGAAAFFQANNSQPPMTAMVNTRPGGGGGRWPPPLEAQGVGGAAPPLAGELPDPLPQRQRGRSWRPSRGGCFTSRTQPPGWQCQPPARRRGCGCWMRAPPPEASPLPPPFRWRTGARWCPATSIPTKDPGSTVGGAAGPVLCPGRSPPTARSAGRSGRGLRPGAGGRALLRAGVIRKKPDIRYKDPEPLASPAGGPERHSGQCLRLCESRAGCCSTPPVPIPPPGEPGGHRPLLEEHPEFVREGFSSPDRRGRSRRDSSPCGPRSTGRTDFTCADCGEGGVTG